MHPRRVLAAAFVILLLMGTPFAVTVSPEPRTEGVPWGDTIRTGVSQATVEQSRGSTIVIPRAEVFYSRYRYVVGYYGMQTLLADLQTTGERAFGQPLSVLVTDFSHTNASVGPDGYLRMSGTYTLPWTAATEAYFVVNSTARLPNGDRAIVPFSKRRDAARFATRYGGTVLRWGELRRRRVETLSRTVARWEEIVDRRQRWANRTVDAARVHLNRSPSVVVGEDAPTLEAAIEQAPPNSTVVLPPGRYDVSDVHVRKSLTIRGAGPDETTIVGDGTESVLYVSAPRTVITGVTITGVGPERSGSNESIPASELDPDRWDYDMRKVHGYGDAAVVIDEAPGSFVSHVRIHTTSNGVLVRHSPRTVVSNLTLYGTKRWDEGFLGVATMGSRIVVQDSRFYGGKVGVYLLEGSGHVVRNSTAEGMMVGVFDLYAEKILISGTRVENTAYGIRVAKRSFGDAVVNNAVWGSREAIVVSGVVSYVAGNTVTQSDRGIVVEGHYSVYTRNVVGFNNVGLAGLELFPTNRVSGNDVVNNDRAATVSGYNVLHVWRGNYWSKAPGLRTTAEGHLVRAYRPTGPVDRLVGRVPHARVLAYSPALSLVRELQRVVPGLRAQGIVDPAPLARPSRPAVVDSIRARYDEARRGSDEDPWDYYGQG